MKGLKIEDLFLPILYKILYNKECEITHYYEHYKTGYEIISEINNIKCTFYLVQEYKCINLTGKYVNCYYIEGYNNIVKDISESDFKDLKKIIQQILADISDKKCEEMKQIYLNFLNNYDRE